MWGFQADWSQACSAGSDRNGKSTGSGCFCLDFFHLLCSVPTLRTFLFFSSSLQLFGGHNSHIQWDFLFLRVGHLFKRCFCDGNLNLRQTVHKKAPCDKEGPAPEGDMSRLINTALEWWEGQLTKWRKLRSSFLRIRQALLCTLCVSGNDNTYRLKCSSTSNAKIM